MYILIKLCILLSVHQLCNGVVYTSPNLQQEKESSYWINHGKEGIKEALRRPLNRKEAKNVILFIGDGLGVTVNTAGRIYKSQKKGHSGEEGTLAWEKFPNIALMKTYNLDKQVADSAATATAYVGGVKANFYTLGVNGKVVADDCQKSLLKENWVSSIIEWAQEVGKDTGIVTTTRVTHASPAATYAHTSNRTWECDSKIPEEHKQCKDIARQLIEDEPGRNINVILAGGRKQFGAEIPKESDPDEVCRKDGVNLIDEWKKQKVDMKVSHSYITNTKEFRETNIEDTDYIIGLFSDSHLPYELDRDKSPEGVPSLSELTTAAIKRLQRSSAGFTLLVEGGRIDHGLHDTKAKYALEELVAMDEAVEAAIGLVDLEETLVIVTADHSHVMTINGYPERGNDILGTNSDNKFIKDNMPYPTLMFTTGVGFNFTWNGTNVVRVNITNLDTTDKDFISPALVPTEGGSETHGGEDVAAWAVGPMAHLFHTTHEQTYVAHVMGYAACMGPYKGDCDRPDRSSYNSIKINKNSSGLGIHGGIQPLSLLVIYSAIYYILSGN